MQEQLCMVMWQGKWLHEQPVAPTPYGTEGTCPHYYEWLGTGGTVSRRTANKKLTKLYWPPRKCSPKRVIVLLEPKTWRGTTKNNFLHFIIIIIIIIIKDIYIAQDR